MFMHCGCRASALPLGLLMAASISNCAFAKGRVFDGQDYAIRATINRNSSFPLLHVDRLSFGLTKRQEVQCRPYGDQFIICGTNVCCPSDTTCQKDGCCPKTAKICGEGLCLDPETSCCGTDVCDPGYECMTSAGSTQTCLFAGRERM